KDYLAEISVEKKVALLTKISYAEYLTKHCKLMPEALPFFQTFTHDLFCIGIESVPAMACYKAGDDYGSFTYDGFQGMGLPEVAYMRGGKLQTVTAKNCVLACYNGMIPYLCPELPEKQKEALSYLVKMPLVYSHVALRNWSSFAKLSMHHIVAPGGYHTYTALDFPVSLGQYRFPSNPAEPALLFMLRTPCKPGLPQRDQNRAGRAELLQTPFSKFERSIRDQLSRMLGGPGFD